MMTMNIIDSVREKGKSTYKMGYRYKMGYNTDECFNPNMDRLSW